MVEQPSSPVDSPDPGNVGAECYCQLDEVMGLLSRQYAMQVVCAVGAAGPVRYGDIEEAFGDVSSSTLSNRLEELVDAGYLDRQQYDEIPPRVEYDLTATGEELCERLRPLLAWARRRDGDPTRPTG